MIFLWLIFIIFVLVSGQGCEDTQPLSIPQRLTCGEKAEELIPNFLIISDEKLTQTDNYYSDRTDVITQEGNNCWDNEVNKENFRQGSQEGENINYLYFVATKGCNGIVYNKKIISNSGIILGTTTFKWSPIIKRKENQIIFKDTYDPEEDTYSLQWIDSNNYLKDYFKLDKIHFAITKMTLMGTETVCEEDLIASQNNTFHCKDLAKSGFEGTFDGFIWRFEINPDIYDNKIYDIKELEVSDCNWVERG